MSSATPAGWYPDPYNAAQLRYWDGAVWTDSVAAAGGQAAADATQQISTDKTDTFPNPFPESGPTGHATGTPPYGQPDGEGPGFAGTGQVGTGPGPGGSTDQWGVPTGPPSLDGVGAGTGGFGATGETVAGPWTGTGSTGTAFGTGTGTGAGNGFGDIGDWLSSIFKKLLSRLGPVIVLLFAIPVVASAIVAVLSQQLLSGVVVDLEPDNDLAFEIAGFSVGLFALIVVLSIVGLLAALVGRLGANHQLYAAHGERPQSLGASLKLALRRLPRAILWTIVLGLLVTILALVFIVLLSVVLVVAVGGGAGDGSPLFALLVVPIALGALLLGTWLWTKLAFFFPALAVGPAGTNPFSASSAISKGRFWSVFGRLLLVAVALWVLWGIFNAIFQPIFGSTAAELFQLDVSTGDVLIDGQNLDTLDEIRWANIVPGAGWFASVTVLYTLGRAIIDAIWASAATGLYWRGGGRGEI